MRNVVAIKVKAVPENAIGSGLVLIDETEVTFDSREEAQVSYTQGVETAEMPQTTISCLVRGIGHFLAIILVVNVLSLITLFGRSCKHEVHDGVTSFRSLVGRPVVVSAVTCDMYGCLR